LHSLTLHFADILFKWYGKVLWLSFRDVLDDLSAGIGEKKGKKKKKAKAFIYTKFTKIT
jgi:hypothetical protein